MRWADKSSPKGKVGVCAMRVSERVAELAHHASDGGGRVDFGNVVNAAEVRSGRMKRMGDVSRVGYLRAEGMDVGGEEALVAIAGEAVVGIIGVGCVVAAAAAAAVGTFVAR
jgi:hypothetical protein